MKYKLKQVECGADWTDFIAKADVASVFFDTGYIDAAVDHFRLLLVMKGASARAALLLVQSADGKSVVQDGLIIHSGLVFVNQSEQKAVNARSERFEISSMVAKWLVSEYESVQFNLLPEFEDLRPLLWLNYHEPPSAPRFEVSVRYTSVLDISELFLKKELEHNALFQELEAKRQKDIRDADAAGLVVTESIESEELVALYQQLMTEQGAAPSPDYLRRMSRLCSYLQSSGKGTIFGIRGAGGKVAYATLFSHHMHHSYYLFAAGDRELMERNHATYCIWSAFLKLSSLGISHVDMEGINSPDRGAFKLGFGGRVVTYFSLRMGSSVR